MGNKLADVRRSKSVNQAELAKLLNVTTSTYCRKENNKIQFNREELELIKNYLGLTDSEFISIFFTNNVALKTT